MVNILDRFEPCHAWVMDMVRFVVENSQLLNIANNDTQIDL